MIRRLLPLAGVLIAISSTGARAETPVITWTCAASNTDTWPMHQPREHYDAGNYPTWSDCLAWRTGSPGPDYLWSYGLTGPTTTTSTTTTAPAPSSTSSSTTSTTPPPTTTLPEPTTTVPEAPPVPSTAQPLETSTTQMVSTTIQPTQQTAIGSTTYPPNTWESTSTTQSPPTNTENPTITQYTSTSSSFPERSTTTTVAPTIERAGDTATAILAADLTTIDPAEAGNLFAALDLDTLTETEAAALVAAVQTAPTAVRAAFEKHVNIFAGATDTYVPLGSRVPVRTRRIIIITTGLLVAMPAPRRPR